MGDFVLAGNMDFLSLGDVLQLLGSNSSTGVLRIRSTYAQEPGLIYFINGNPVNASAGPLTGLDAVNALFGWVDGEFEFSEKDIRRKNVIKKSRMQIILDCLSMLDDGEIERLGPVSFPVKKKSSSEKESTLPVIKGPLIDYSYVVDEEEARAGNKIVAQGKHGGWLWVILEGVAEIIRETPKGPLKILRIGEGAFIGSIASFLLLEGTVRSAAIRAVENVQLGVLDSRRLSIDFLRMSNPFRSLAISLDKRLKQVTDMAVNIHLEKIRIEDYINGKNQLIAQGDSEADLYQITEGDAHIVRHTENGYVPLANLHSGDFFGNVSFLDLGQEPYQASVFASEDLKITKIDPDILQEEHNRLSPTFKNFIEHLATCVSVTTMLACEFHKKTGDKGP
ncbi:MAG: cyclic nucleotide-binding domain-containing protein [Deltaproteobacteria bacterium]|nr:cyclic nucleotide-binding domain-containing protein [Deltaproteobacteria bacterium]